MTPQVGDRFIATDNAGAGAAYDRLREQLERADSLLRQIRDGKHSLPGTLVQIDRYFEQHGKGLKA